MDNSIYEVERDDYKAFIGQLNPSMMDTEIEVLGECTFTKILSKKTGRHLSTRVEDNELQKESYFIFNYPDDDERLAPKPILKIDLNTREEVQTFLNAISKIQRERDNDGNI